MDYPTKEAVYAYVEKLSSVAAEQWLAAADADADDDEQAKWLEEVLAFFDDQKRAIARMSTTVPFRAWCNWWVREVDPHMPAIS